MVLGIFLAWGKRRSWTIVLYEIRGKYQSLFIQGSGPRHKVMESRATQVESWPRHCRRLTIDWLTAIYHTHPGLVDHDLTTITCYQQIKAIISHHHRCIPCFRIPSNLDWLMLEIFRRQKLQSVLLESLTCIRKVFSFVYPWIRLESSFPIL